jgi:hypothetical protein
VAGFSAGHWLGNPIHMRPSVKNPGLTPDRVTKTHEHAGEFSEW